VGHKTSNQSACLAAAAATTADVRDDDIDGTRCGCFAVEENELFDFRGLRMDWYRLQVCNIYPNRMFTARLWPGGVIVTELDFRLRGRKLPALPLSGQVVHTPASITKQYNYNA